jgi:tRNA A-37 threonylcarbamoyl transferase component Bud32
VKTTLPEPGTRVGEGGTYRVMRKLGEGGMGAVFEAEHALTGKRVALKWMHPEVGAAPELAARFLREAQAAARVRHPNVVDVYDFGQDGDAAYLVMECLEGETLGAALARGGLSPGEVIALLLPAMRATSAAHKQGVVHRDIKPDNIFLSRHEQSVEPKLLDFGISRLDARDGAAQGLTRTGTTMGTPRYMSYEQLAGEKDIDGRADVYAFGVILYEVLTGKPPFDADTFSALVVKVATTAPTPVAALRADLPEKLTDAVRWAMERDRNTRCPSMDALIAALEPFASFAGGKHTPAALAQAAAAAASTPLAGVVARTEARGPLPARKWGTAIAALALGAGVLGAAAWMRSTGSHAAPPVPIAPSRAAGERRAAGAADVHPPLARDEQPHSHAASRAAQGGGVGVAGASEERERPARRKAQAEASRAGREGAREVEADSAPVQPVTAAPAAEPPAAPSAPPRAEDAKDPGYYYTPDGRKIVRAPKPGGKGSDPSQAAPYVTSDGRKIIPAP